MTYEEMLKGLSAYIKHQCLKRYVEWQVEQNKVWLHIDPAFKRKEGEES